MEQGSLAKKVSEFVEPFIESMKLKLWGVEVTSANRPAVIIYLDGPDGVSIDQCATVSREIGLMLEVEEVIDSAYILEVSSPGLERKFFKPEQLSDYIGKKLNIVLIFSLEGRKKFKGILKETDEEGLLLSLEDQEDPVKLEWDRIKKVKLIHEFK
ncbi:ribosome maturation factor RimP [Maridesulfovibrio hydrothermalis]|uniref:Ribosome maturation factor RimP n=1 Tax=Maridesulfovibrio hydrothermalis AM13 = DSM 14728 TaxID=1121451 RepID=L0RCR9_9BACT|nr:ribosome maturation factor RimP [Maridesulfovibrio hydrothermalis]CCO23980.1 Ribosome maturation factor rimP [Maridesulfovibrio hydrothermalis AM13 = DSM 14728]